MDVTVNNTFIKKPSIQFDLVSILVEATNNSSLLITKKIFKNKDYVYFSKEEAKHIYFIVKGSVKVEKNVRRNNVITKNIFSKGELFGEIALTENSFRADYAQAMEETELYIISSNDFKTFMLNNPNLSGYVFNLISKRLIEAELKIESYAFNNSRTRIIEFLVNLVKKNGQRIGYEILVRKFYTHQEIANCTATSRQTVTTVLNELKRENLITFNRKRLIVRNLELLKKEMDY